MTSILCSPWGQKGAGGLPWPDAVMLPTSSKNSLYPQEPPHLYKVHNQEQELAFLFSIKDHRVSVASTLPMAPKQPQAILK